MTGGTPVTGGTGRRRIALRVGADLSLLLDRRTLVVLGITGLTVLAGVAFTVAVGSYPVPLGQVIAALRHQATHENQVVVTTLRLPRVSLAVFVGAALGMSGALFQGVAQNPLVAPDIIGVTTGASAAVVLAVVVGGTGQPPLLWALVGAVAAGALGYLLSLRSGLSQHRMILIGIGVSAAISSAITYLMTTIPPAQLGQYASLNQWLLGDLSSATGQDLRTIAAPTVGLLIIGTALGRRFEILQLGDAVATGLGLNAARTRAALLLVGVGLAAVAVSVTGPIGFVAFICPNIARRLTRGSAAGVLPVSAALGAALLVVADYAAQRLLEPTQIPVGAVTILLGAPYFMYLLLRAARSGLVS